MRLTPGAALILLSLGACSAEPEREDIPIAAINAAATDAQGDIDTYAANSLQPAPVPTAAPPPKPAVTAVADDAQAALAVVRDYYGLIDARRYEQARQLWKDGGAASGMTARQFADSFAKYADYRATIGRPGRIDAGAGQRYIAIPVAVAGTLVAGDRPFALAGDMILHRTADIDDATAAQRFWRISDSSLRPRSDLAATALPPVATAAYRCGGTTRVSVRFDNRADTVILRSGDRDLAVLDGQRVGSGIWYKGEGYELRGKGDRADLTMPGRPALACTAE